MTILKTAAALSAVACIVFLVSTDAEARYPQISPIGDIAINMNESGPLMRFWVSDDSTPPGELVLTYRSDNPALVPEDDNHITLGGSGQDRTVIVTPAEDQYGFANITIIVKDDDGDQNREPFQVRVNRPL
ncbi:MAG TPA: hypothetical protein PLY45_02540 [bacterium]|nr:hypothetical protein [bacterium]